jgi:hypothetical protein
MAKVIGIAMVLVLFMVQASEVCAWGRDERRHDFYYTPHYIPHGREVHALPHDHMRLIIGGLEYYYWEGMFYKVRADRYVVVPAPIGAVVTAIPQGCQPVIVDGTPYYNINGVTYMYTPYGYQVVPQPKTIIVKNYVSTESATAPALLSAPTAIPGADTGSDADTFTVNVPNPKGAYTPVALKRSGNGFVGPQGEYYAEFPRVEQLKVMYAK